MRNAKFIIISRLAVVFTATLEIRLDLAINRSVRSIDVLLAISGKISKF
jgi:hypothetical protein